MQRPIVSYLVLMLAPWLVYALAIPGEFVYDDIAITVVENPALQGEVSAWAILQWQRPLREFTYQLDHALWGFWSPGYHVQNIVWHMLNGLLLFALLRRLQMPAGGALAAALLFSVHPIQVEPVAWISGRKELLCLFFQLLSIYAWLIWLARTGKRAYGWLALSVLSLGLALLSKQVAVIAPGLLLLVSAVHDRTQGQGLHWRRWLWALLHVGLVLLYVLFRSGLLSRLENVFAMGTHYDPAARDVSYTLLSALLTPFATLGRSVGLLLFPADLTIERAFEPVQALDDWRWWAGLFALAAAGAISFLLWRKTLWFAAGTVWFLLTWLPTSGAIPLGYLIADRYLYVPSIGFCLAVVALGGALLPRDRRVQAALLIALLLGLSLRSVDRTLDWRDPIALWQSATEARPHNPKAWSGLGNAYARAGETEKAFDAWQAALSLDPRLPQVWVNMGGAYRQAGELQKAEKAYRKALDILPDYGVAYYNLGVLEERRGNLDRALHFYQLATRHLYGKRNEERRKGMAHYQVARLLTAQGELQAARSHLTYAERFAPNHAPLYVLKGQIASRSAAEARQAFETAIALDAEHAAAWFHLGVLAYEQGSPNEAQGYWKRAVQLDPAYQERIQAIQPRLAPNQSQ